MRDGKRGQLMSKRETDWFRGIAVVMVVLSHYAEWWAWFTPTEGNMEIFRQGLTKLGVYGVDLFFLFSGYAMVKSMKQERMYPQFIWKRIKNVYIPYFIVVGIIELISGGFTSFQDFGMFASGYDYWYMFVLFIFYIGFIVIYTIVGGKLPRVLAFSAFTYVFSYILYDKGMQDFWYVSNIVFALGVICGEYEEYVKKAADKIGIPLIALLSIGMIFVVRSGLIAQEWKGAKTPEQLIWLEIGATMIWSLLIMTLASKLKIKEKIFAFIGRSSLYIYLIHTFIFMWCVNNLEDMSYIMRFLISALITIFTSFVINYIYTAVGKLISKGNNRKKEAKMV